MIRAILKELRCGAPSGFGSAGFSTAMSEEEEWAEGTAPFVFCPSICSLLASVSVSFDVTAAGAAALGTASWPVAMGVPSIAAVVASDFSSVIPVLDVSVIVTGPPSGDAMAQFGREISSPDHG